MPSPAKSDTNINYPPETHSPASPESTPENVTSGSQDSSVPTDDDYTDLTPRTVAEVVGPQTGRVYGTRWCPLREEVVRFARGRGGCRKGRRLFLPLRAEVVGIRHRKDRGGERGIDLLGLWRQKNDLCLVGEGAGSVVHLSGPRRNPGEFLHVNNDKSERLPEVLRI